jgi:hypothetical protein
VGGAAAAGANKRKRQSSTAATVKTPKFAAPLVPKVEVAENSQHKVFFDAQAALANGTTDPWAAITSAMQEYEAAKAGSAKEALRAFAQAQAQGLSSATTTSSAAGPSTARMVPRIPVPPAPAPAAIGPSDDELFAEFMDLDSTFFPTPELLSDIVDDYSPESIRTVGSVKPAPWTLGPDDTSPVNTKSATLSGSGGMTKDEVFDEEEENGLAFMSVPQSPASMAYNGGLVFG